MDQVNFGYSTKNIPIPNKKDYLQQLIKSAEKFIRTARWRSHFFLKPTTSKTDKETYGFNSTKTPPNIPLLKEFEDGILNIVQTVRFRKVSDKFQKQLTKDTNKIKQSKQLIIPADKTTNFYKVNTTDYKKLLDENITKNYKKATSEIENTISIEDKNIATKLEIDDRINTTAKKQAYITLKDHKPNFNNKPTCRLINPTKSEIGKISKQILEKINTNTRSATKLNQWKNTNEVIDWYGKITDKPTHSFICFDVCEFYPSITDELLHKALKFAEKYNTITEQEKHIIRHTKKSLLYNNEQPWCKRTNSNFDVTMGSFDGAETCELVGLYILSQLEPLGINIGLYRDDGLAVCNKTPRQIETIKKEICKIFKNNKLKITIEANLKHINFLDMTMDLRTANYKPYMKPNNTPSYVHKESNHPPNITKNIPESINRRLSNLSSNESIFKQTTQPYQQALTKSGYSYTLKYQTNNITPKPSTKARTRKRNIIWFNPPYNKSVTTNIGKKFLQLLDDCFPSSHPLHKLLNKNTVKISYSCTPNINQIISNHNKTIINKTRPTEPTTRNCNCRNNTICPLDGNCLTQGVIYQATVKRNDNDKEETYIGLTDNTFKTRYNLHTCSFRNSNKRNATKLSQYIWSLKDKGVQHNLKWKIIAKSKSYSTSTKTCNLCLKEKYFIICKPELSTLNSRNELASECRHRKSHLLSNFKS